MRLWATVKTFNSLIQRHTLYLPNLQVRPTTDLPDELDEVCLVVHSFLDVLGTSHADAEEEIFGEGSLGRKKCDPVGSPCLFMSWIESCRTVILTYLLADRRRYASTEITT